MQFYRVFGYFRKLRQTTRSCTMFVSSMNDKERQLDKIHLEGLKIFGYHGVLPEEKEKGQNFLIDATLYLNLGLSGKTDNLKHTVNYSSVYEDIEQVMRGPSSDLIEHLAQSICEKILKEYPPVQKVQISIRKPEAPLPSPKDSFQSVGQSLPPHESNILASVEHVRGNNTAEKAKSTSAGKRRMK